ncbi:peptidoglycan-binding domain-containing protein [Pyxidicoccus trucidator]|uniref:peptidoglycan-binding domain-containing protein n=1 Tax=Pyxidicoccus trucidator TaxID=2709662 RepID=UPI0013DC5131|nr:peptidoglycan-binding domain-containing protein [Pyxidicoccus trucidator]
MGRHRIEQGDSIVKLAQLHGFFPDTLWNHPDNADLKALRKDMNVLAPGDVVVVPELRERVERCPTGKRHTFRRRGVPMLFRVQLFERNEPRKNQSYELEVDGKRYTGTTDAEGKIELYLPTRAQRGRLVVGGGQLDMEVLFGHMDPITELSGVQKRLANLGFECGAIDGQLHARLAAALRAFQALVGLEPTGEPDDRTRAALADCHDQPGKLAELTAAAAKAGG